MTERGYSSLFFCMTLDHLTERWLKLSTTYLTCFQLDEKIKLHWSDEKGKIAVREITGKFYHKSGAMSYTDLQSIRTQEN